MKSDATVLLIKLGGASITIKNQFETLNEFILDECIKHIATLYQSQNYKIILVHGAGSFGHFQASKAKLLVGGDESISSADLNIGFSQTHQSVSQLNLEVVRRLNSTNIPAVGVSPLGIWKTNNNTEIVIDGSAHIFDILNQGIIPVLHGDAILDDSLKYTILSGDAILRILCEKLDPLTRKRVVFMTNVSGIYDQHPDLNNTAQLLRKIKLTDVCKMDWVAYTMENEEIRKDSVTMTMNKHDVTGGMEKKVEEAVCIAKHGIVVRIVQAGSKHALHACLDSIMSNDWIGTEVVVDNNTNYKNSS